MKQERPVSIVISSGHTGGHFFPAVSFALRFKKAHPEAAVQLLLGRMPSFANVLISERGLESCLIEIPPFPKIFSFKMVLFLLNYIVVFIKTFVYLVRLKPSLVVGFGSYASVPSVLCAAMLGIPTLLHEQNVMAGRANRLLARVVDHVAISFPETKGIPASRKVAWTGYPLREDFLNLINSNEFKTGREPFRILVFGGSQGARRLNQVFLEALGQFRAEEKKNLAVKHIAGSEGLEEIKSSYQRIGVQAMVTDFSHHIAEDYNSADLIISRSGAGTVFELIAARRPAILIPYPHAYAHQRLNGEFLASRSAAVMILEEHLTADRLAGAILDLKNNLAHRSSLVANLQSLYKPNAADDLVQLAWGLACRKN